MHPAYDKPLPEGWSGGNPVTKYWGGNYVHLYRVTRPCATCGAEISLRRNQGGAGWLKKERRAFAAELPKMPRRAQGRRCWIAWRPIKADCRSGGARCGGR